MQVADLFRPPLGVLSVKCPSRANQASGLAGGFDWLEGDTGACALYPGFVGVLFKEEGI